MYTYVCVFDCVCKYVYIYIYIYMCVTLRDRGRGNLILGAQQAYGRENLYIHVAVCLFVVRVFVCACSCAYVCVCTCMCVRVFHPCGTACDVCVCMSVCGFVLMAPRYSEKSAIVVFMLVSLVVSPFRGSLPALNSNFAAHKAYAW